MTKEDFDNSMDVEILNKSVGSNGQERENLSMPTKEKTLEYVLDRNFLRGILYGTIPITICTLILSFAYRRDLMSSRSSTSPVFKIPVILTLLLAFAFPFITKHGDETFLRMFPTFNFGGVGGGGQNNPQPGARPNNPQPPNLPQPIIPPPPKPPGNPTN